MIALKVFSDRFSHINRSRKLSYALNYIAKHHIKSILIVGAALSTSGPSFVNLIEKGLSRVSSRFVVCGLEEKSEYWSTWVQADGRALPFQDKEFDFVFSNAVIEHVGNESDQIQFIKEIVRVGKNWMITTPNRLFPIESHTQILFRHMSKTWDSPKVSRLLSRNDLASIVPASTYIKGWRFSPTFIAHS